MQQKYLNEAQKAELNLFFKLPSVVKIMEYAQYCLTIEGIEHENIVKGVSRAIQQINQRIDPAVAEQRRQKTKSSIALFASKNIKQRVEKNKKINLNTIPVEDLEQIIHNMLQYMQTQSNEFFNYLALQYIKTGYSRNLDLGEFLTEYSRKSLHTLNFNVKNTKICIDVPANGLKILQKAEACIKGHHQADWRYILIGKLGIFWCIALFFMDGIENNFEVNTFQVRNIFMLMFAYTVYSYGHRFVNLTFNIERRDFSNLDFPHYQLEEIKVIHSADQPTKEISYLPNFDDNFQEDFSSDNHNLHDRKKERQVNPHQKIKTRPQTDASLTVRNSSTLPKPPLSTSLCWSGKLVWFHDSKSNISSQETYEMRSKFFSKSRRYFGFFNAPALRAQQLSENDIEWKNYQARVREGNIVSPIGNTGIKQLKPRILANVKILDVKFDRQLFSWSLKTVKTNPRCLGRTADIQMDADGIQYRLVDFCWHLPEGPGH